MNFWIQHVKKVAADKGISYVAALKVASESYKASAPESSPPAVVSKTKMRSPKGGKKRIDFSKIHWGAFTQDWKDMGKSFPSLYDFATDVLKRSSEYPPITVKRARFYKNIIMKGKGLGMCM